MSLIGLVGSWFLVNWYNVFPLFITIAICGLVIYGNKQEKSWMFLPFLIFEVSFMVRWDNEIPALSNQIV